MTDTPADDSNSNSTDTGNSEVTVSEPVAQAVESLEEATAEAFAAAVESGDIERAEQIAARVVEGMRRAIAEVESAAESVEELAEEVAENAPTEEAAEKAEDAVDSAREAQDAAEDAERELREEVRDQGGKDQVEGDAVDAAIHEEAIEAKEELPVDAAPAVDAEEEFEQEIADTAEATADTSPPPLITPEAAHPYYRKRKIKVPFTNRTINL